MQEKDLIKYIKGDASPDEKKLVIEWIKKDSEHQKRFSLLKAEYIASTLDSFSNMDVKTQYQRFASKKSKKRKYYYTAAIAASVVVPFMMWYMFTSSSYDNSIVDVTEIFDSSTKNVTTGHGGYKTVVLPDGSTIVLNANSSLTYPNTFTDSVRKVTLIGEAFFDIKRDVTKPFIVTTDHINIKVLGTSFNVKSYPKDEKIETTLVTGKVEVFQQQKEKPIVLEPSQRAVFDKEKSNIKVDRVDSKSIVAWQEGKLIFDKTPLKQVVLDLNRKYNVEFVIKSDSLLQYKYTGEFDNLTLKEVLELLKISSPINYKYVNNKVMLNSE
ncbi:FecR family protein [Aquimarina sp. MAR_2010_214]|uniref:FecR family protein n=1 Tax=Aquimarina sp. MAR_2010_214 TaxID=1250026 RepID=UPI000C70F2BF|nr:FecR domain-containing protein [Aquimarina sp. MAR_2010_214]PKV51211.1 FecR family protein [Aquimarina sp. MAR_2010_214]